MKDKRKINAWRGMTRMSLKQYVRNILRAGDYPEALQGAALRWAITKGLVFTDGLGKFALREAGR